MLHIVVLAEDVILNVHMYAESNSSIKQNY